jgi:hypothetical protein
MPTTKKAKSAKGVRAVVVVDRGWIFAGDVVDSNGRVYLSRAVHVLSWSSGGFATLLSDPVKAGAKLAPCSDVEVPAGSEIFRCPVSQDWGL